MKSTRKGTTRIKMERVDNPDATMSILIPKPTPPIRGQSHTDYTCAGCGKILLRRVLNTPVQRLVFRCPLCGTHSRVPASA
jgi:DNA-directed RNA polymerase subunit RPC12/RpoP